MGIGVTEEHAALAESVRRWTQRHAPPEAMRATDVDADRSLLEALAAQDLCGVHEAAGLGGGGGTFVDLAIVTAGLGGALVPGSFLPTVTVSAVLQLSGYHNHALRRRLINGQAVATHALGTDGLRAERDGEVIVVNGTSQAVPYGDVAGVLLLGADLGGEDIWFVIDATAADATQLDSLDPTRPLSTITLDSHRVDVDSLVAALDGDTLRAVAATFAAAEAAGVAQWCLTTAVEHAKVREQFDRPIGQFQAVKHTCADMLVATEQAWACAWDAARAATDPTQRPLASAVAAAVALAAAVQSAKACIQILGGIGFTWDHDAHRYLRRAVAQRQLHGPVTAWRRRAAVLAASGDRRQLGVELAAEDTADQRQEVRAFLDSLADLDDAQRRRRIADAGYIAPHWPRPWGRAASPTEQLVIDEEFQAAGVTRPDLLIGGWILPTLIAHGTTQQQERFIGPTLGGDITWCQMFSEPGAGSDLASLTTKASRVDGGWVLSGQKVWTSLAHRSDYGLCLARTDASAPKHEGITCVIVDMRADGLDIRPLREITGRAIFNEVFLNDVFVPDDMVVGAVNDGWRTGRTTLANERVAMSTGSTMGAGVEGVLRTVGATALDPAAEDRVGQLVCEGQGLALLGLRTTLRRLQGLDPGAGSSIRKLVGMHHAQACAELALELLGPAGATAEGPAAVVTAGFLQSRCLTIAGGTTEVQRNVIGERLLGLPRDDAVPRGFGARAENA